MTTRMGVGILLGIWVVNFLMVCRISVFSKQRVWERQVRGESKPPFFTLSLDGSSLDLLRRDEYTPEGQRLLPWLRAGMVIWCAAILVVMASVVCTTGAPD